MNSLTALTPEQQLALREIRTSLYDRLKNFKFTKEMLEGLSLFHLLNLIQLVAGANNYLGMFSPTLWSLQQIFGDAVWDAPEKQSKSKESKESRTDEEEKEAKEAKAEVIH